MSEKVTINLAITYKKINVVEISLRSIPYIIFKRNDINALNIIKMRCLMGLQHADIRIEKLELDINTILGYKTFISLERYDKHKDRVITVKNKDLYLNKIKEILTFLNDDRMKNVILYLDITNNLGKMEIYEIFIDFIQT